MEKTLPNDADGDALRGLIEDGYDLSKPIQIDFHISIPSESAGNDLIQITENLSFISDLDYDDDTDSWTCWCSKSMIPEYDLLIQTQKQLNKLAKKVGGHADGWSSFGN